MACIEAVHAISHPQLSVSLSLTLNHCTVLCETGEETFPLLAHTAETAKFSLFHFFSTLHLGHMSVCVAVLSHTVAVSNALMRRQGVNFQGGCELVGGHFVVRHIDGLTECVKLHSLIVH